MMSQKLKKRELWMVDTNINQNFSLREHYYNPEEAINSLVLGNVIRLSVGEPPNGGLYLWVVITKIKKSTRGRIRCFYGTSLSWGRQCTTSFDKYEKYIQTGETIRFKPENIIEIDECNTLPSLDEYEDGLICDECSKHSIGLYYHSNIHIDRDLCQHCYQTNQHQPENRNMRVINVKTTL